MSYELAHYGVRGMRWGVRRYQRKDGSLTPEGRKRYSEEESPKPAAPNKKKSVSSMSNADLRNEIERLELEQRYRRLASESAKLNRTTSQKAKEYVKNILIESGNDVGKKFAKYAMSVGVNKLFEKTFNDPDILNIRGGKKDKDKDNK